MLIDWFTVGAQGLNFVILVWLLKRLLYKPILDAIDAREKYIAAQLTEADTKRADAQKEHDECRQKISHFEQTRDARMNEVTQQAKAERERLLDDARRAADALTSKRQEALKSDAQRLDQAINRWTQQEVLAIARKALMDLSDTSLEERMTEVFIRRLRDLDVEAKARLAAAFKIAAEPALVCSAFELAVAQRASVQKALNEALSADVRVRFETNPDVIGGIEVTGDGQKLAWSIAEYLTSFRNDVSKLLDVPPTDPPQAHGEAKLNPVAA